jgi:hypothetical protein
MSKKTISKMLFSNQERVELALTDDLQDILDVFAKKLNPTFKEISKAKNELRQAGSQEKIIPDMRIVFKSVQ